MTQDWTHDDPAYDSFMSNSKLFYEEALNSLENPDPPCEFNGEIQDKTYFILKFYIMFRNGGLQSKCSLPYLIGLINYRVTNI